MDQEKIGKFISKIRRERKMTQQELANRLGVTDKAISKWENGRCMMDISMLKPLSECLGVTIMELINGEKINNEERILRTDDTIEKTIGYVNIKVKMVVKSIIRIFCGVILGLLFLFGWFLYKSYCAYIIYYVYESDYFIDGKSNEMVFNCLNNNDQIEIYGKDIDESEYLVLDNLKIRNDFKKFEREENKEDRVIFFRNYTDKEVVSFSVKDTYVNMFKTYSYSSDKGDTENKREEFLLDNKIDNDIDLFNYIKNNFYIENYWYNSIETLRNNYMVNSFTLDVFTGCDDSTRINGLYNGYIYDYSYNDIDTGEVNNIRIVEIFDDDMVYSITFNGDRFKDNDYIKDILSTLIIK